MAYWQDRPGGENQPVDWRAVAIFFVVACGWSWVASRYAVTAWPGPPPAPRFDNSIIAGFGPAIGALVAGIVRRERRSPLVTLLGKRQLATVLALAAPVLTMAAFGLPRARIEPHLAGAIFALSVVVYSIGEEMGWRGWLYGALGGLRLWQSVLVTAVLWFAWHWTFWRAS